MDKAFPISVIILTYNEEKNIAPCLETLKWAEDIILVDSGSEDETLAVACATRPDIRIFQRAFTDFGDQRNWALDNTSPRHEWILFLDADERCTQKCAEAIQNAVRNPGDYVGFFLTCRNFFLDRWIKRCTLYPSWQLRLLRKGYVRFQKEGHGQREIANGPLGYIREPYDHYGFSKGISHWIERHNHYSTNEAELILRLRNEPLRLHELFFRDPVKRRRCLKRLAARLVISRPIARFIYLYFIRGGILEGKPGLLFCLLRFAHEVHIAAKLAEMQSNASLSTLE
jgi:glycosyltransferase involved in cell wall biosynthesis